jgi:uncharacterized integral membrane protein (TIGR00698 family)
MIKTRAVVFVLAAFFCLTPWITPPVALLLGLGFALSIGNPFERINHRISQILLQASVVGLGFGMNITDVLKAGRQGIFFTIASISGTLIVGWLLGRILKIEKKTSFLIAGGTAICGGSAIAALAPVVRADQRQISISLGTVFILNSIALFLFPFIGHLQHLSQDQFGLWSAIAIHDTSSVVGAAGRYGPAALQIATTVKLARALWIIPLSLLAGFLCQREISGHEIDPASHSAVPLRRKGPPIVIPWFIGLFILAILANTWLPIPRLNAAIVRSAHAGLTLTLFLIGAGLSPEVLKNTGLRPLLQGILLWAFISAAALWAVIHLAH